MSEHVTTHTDPRRALCQFRSQSEAWDVVIADLTMPGMTGVALAAEMLQVRPKLRILLATGFHGSWTLEKVQALGIFDLVQKPFTLAALSEVVQRALQGADTNINRT